MRQLKAFAFLDDVALFPFGQVQFRQFEFDLHVFEPAARFALFDRQVLLGGDLDV